MEAIAERLAAVEARLAIQDLVGRYALAVDSRNLDALISLYVDDVALGGGETGREGLREQFAAILRGFYRSVHMIMGQVIELKDADHATGTVYCRAEQEEGGEWSAMAICYFDSYERREGQWLFAERKIRSFYKAELAKGPVAPYNALPGGAADRRINLPQRWPSWGDFWADVPQEEVARLTSAP